jgi:hypothetical protein
VVKPRTRVTLSGVVRSVTGAVVQKSTDGTTWTQLRSITTQGAFTFGVKPKMTTQYRLATPDDAAAPVRIRVGPATLRK